jgi:sortase B
MFGKLSKYESEDFYSKDMNPLFFIYTEDKIMMYRIFSVHICEPTDAETYSFNFSDNASLQEYADKMKSLSIYDTSVDISDVSQVITLSTCTDDLSQRLVVQAKYVNEAKLP